MGVRNYNTSTILLRYKLDSESKMIISNNFPSHVKEIIHGMILGDGTIIKNGNNACLRIKQKDKSFVDYIYNIFKPFNIVGAEPNITSSIIKPSGNIRIAYYFSTITLFSELHLHWYKQVHGKNIKIIPSNISDLLTPIAISYWIAGDESYHKRDGVVHIATHGFEKVEVQLLMEILLVKYNLSSTINIGRNSKGVEQYFIRIPNREVNKLQNLIKEQIPPMMSYRIGL